MPSERWKQIPPFPLYEVSSLGRFRFSETKKKIIPYQNGKGVLTLWIKEYKACRNAKSLVWETFKEKLPRNLGVICKDGDERNIRVSNLVTARKGLSRYAAILETVKPHVETKTFEQIIEEIWRESCPTLMKNHVSA